MKELEYPFDGQLLMRKRKTLRKELLLQKNLTEKHIAILGGSTTHDIREMLELFLLNYGIRPVFYESEYGQYWQDAVFENDELAAFKPDLIFIHTSNRNITKWPDVSDSESKISELLEAQFSHFRMMWETLERTYHCPIIQNNFEQPFFRLLGNRDVSDIHGRSNFVNQLNEKFYIYAQSREAFYIHDIQYLAADFGLSKWSDPFYWHMYKYCLSVEAIPAFAFSLANIVKAIYGKNRKAIALDLDNTLWGGIVGDDGVESLELGQETSMGQAYTEFQLYLQQLQKQGILLTVLSKNEKENALAGLQHPQMVLKPEDFITIKANWDPKSRNLLETAQELSLLPEAFVFADDNPAEREIIRQQVPGVGVPELSRVEEYIPAIDRAGYFENVSLSKDDLRRNEMYRENAKRAELQNSFSDYNDYLLSLEMQAEIKPFEPMYMARIAQLTNKSNQFNLTTKRYTLEEIEQAASDENIITLYGKLRDRFGDNGVVSLVIGEIHGEELKIVLWLMSCRVLKRDMEFAMMDKLAETCSLKGIKYLKGYYYPTAKNSMVKDFYATQGFEKSSEDQEGNTVWTLDLSNGYEKKNQVIQIL